MQTSCIHTAYSHLLQSMQCALLSYVVSSKDTTFTVKEHFVYPGPLYEFSFKMLRKFKKFKIQSAEELLEFGCGI